MEKPIGKTRDVGFQFGIRKSFAKEAPWLWAWLCSSEGTRLWIGHEAGDLSPEFKFVGTDGTNASIRVFRQGSHLRMNWRIADMQNDCTLQLRVIPQKSGSTLSFHLEKLRDVAQRESMKVYWTQVMERLSAAPPTIIPDLAGTAPGNCNLGLLHLNPYL